MCVENQVLPDEHGTTENRPVIGFVAPSGSGKTTLLRRLVAVFHARGLRVGYLKHAHHTFDLDVPGKDSFEIRAAGAVQTLLASRERWALQVENPLKETDPDLRAMLARFAPGEFEPVSRQAKAMAAAAARAGKAPRMVVEPAASSDVIVSLGYDATVPSSQAHTTRLRPEVLAR